MRLFQAIVVSEFVGLKQLFIAAKNHLHFDVLNNSTEVNSKNLSNININ